MDVQMFSRHKLLVFLSIHLEVINRDFIVIIYFSLFCLNIKTMLFLRWQNDIKRVDRIQFRYKEPIHIFENLFLGLSAILLIPDAWAFRICASQCSKVCIICLQNKNPRPFLCPRPCSLFFTPSIFRISIHAFFLNMQKYEMISTSMDSSWSI